MTVRVIVCVAVLSVAADAAARSQQGVVLDGDTAEPVAAAIVVAGGVEALTSDDGSFELADLPRGSLDVLVIADGYEPGLYQRRPGAPWRLRLVRDRSVADVELIVLESETPPPVEPVPYDLSGDVIRRLPGAGNDALKSLQSLPGVARVPFGLGGLALRGAAPRDSAVYLDGIEVPLLFHFGGLASFYPSALTGSIELSPSGFSARYGRAQGGLVEVSTRAPRTDGWRAAGEVSLIDAQVRAEGPSGDSGGGWTMGVRRSYVDAVLAAVDTGLTLSPRYWDAQVAWRSGAAPSSGEWSAIAFASSDGLELRVDDDDPTAPDDALDYVSRFVRAGARYRRAWGPTELDVTGSLGFDDVQLSYNDEGVVRRGLPIATRATLTRSFDGGFVAGGVDAVATRHSIAIDGDAPARPGTPMSSDAGRRATTTWGTDVAVWIEALHPVAGPAIAIKPGLRGERLGLSDEWVLDPRLDVLHDLGRVTVTESIGLYHQPVSVVDLDPALGGQDLVASKAVQASIGAVVDTGVAGVEVGATAYGASLRDLAADVVTGATPITAGGSRQAGGIGAIATELADDQFGTYSYKRSVGRGRTWGTELLVRRRGQDWTGWLSYTYGRSLRRGDPATGATYLPYVFDQPHVLTALGSMGLGRWRLGARVQVASGNPYTPVAGAYYDADRVEYRPRDGAVLSERLPTFVQLDLRVDRRWRRSWGEVGLFIDLQNATNRFNAEGVTYNFDYSERSFTRGLPIYPSIGVEVVQ